MTLSTRTAQVRRDHLAARRRTVVLSQEALAARLGVQRTTVTRWESGATTPMAWVRPGLAEALGVSSLTLDAMFTAQPSPPPATGLANVIATIDSIFATGAPGVSQVAVGHGGVWIEPGNGRIRHRVVNGPAP
ncbi:helix-turn-helix domain-containing protein [Promicromonospora sp. NPDC057138]|uniref:helix-turn-helix domain-containing protein n=1 Tax=Promicromonospora sp. NPDC057138 TaxID=3346031 RepID=UPI003632CBE2